MAKGSKVFQEIKAAMRKAEPDPWTPEWIEANRDKLISTAGKLQDFKLVTEDELKEEVKKQAEKLSPEQVLAALGLDVAALKQTSHVRLDDKTKIIDDTAAQIDVLYHSMQWRSLMTPEQKASLHAVRVFIRQLRNETAPPGQASCLADLLKHVKIPEGVFGTRGSGTKQIKVSQKHYDAAGIGD